MKPSGCLLDTGPLLALLVKNDIHHEKIKTILKNLKPPLRTCEAVISEACFLVGQADPNGPEEIMKLGQNGFYEIAFDMEENHSSLQSLFKKYKDQKISLADACLIRMAEVFEESRILTFDSDFKIYRWDRNKPFAFLIE